MLTNPTQNPTQTRRKTSARVAGCLKVPDAPAHGSASDADPRTGATGTGTLGNSATRRSQKRDGLMAWGNGA